MTVKEGSANRCPASTAWPPPSGPTRRMSCPDRATTCHVTPRNFTRAPTFTDRPGIAPRAHRAPPVSPGLPEPRGLTRTRSCSGVVEVCRQLSVPQGVEDARKNLDRVAGRFGAFDQRPRPRECPNNRRRQTGAAGVAGVAVAGQPFQVGGQNTLERRQAPVDPADVRARLRNPPRRPFSRVRRRRRGGWGSRRAVRCRRHAGRRAAAPRNGPARGMTPAAAAPAAPPGPSPPGRGPAPSAGRASHSTLRPRAARSSPTTTGPAPHRRPGTTGNADTGGKSSNATVIAASAHRCCTICPTGSEEHRLERPPKRPTAARPARLGLPLCWSPAPAKPAPADAHRRFQNSCHERVRCIGQQPTRPPAHRAQLSSSRPPAVSMSRSTAADMFTHWSHLFQRHAAVHRRQGGPLPGVLDQAGTADRDRAAAAGRHRRSVRLCTPRSCNSCSWTLSSVLVISPALLGGHRSPPHRPRTGRLPLLAQHASALPGQVTA